MLFWGTVSEVNFQEFVSVGYNIHLSGTKNERHSGQCDYTKALHVIMI